MNEKAEAKKVKLEISMEVGFLIGALFLIISVCAYLFMPAAETSFVVFAVSVCSAIAIILSAYYVGETLRVNVEREKMNKSFVLTRALNSLPISRVRTFIDKIVKEKTKMSPEQQYEVIKNDDNLQAGVLTVLGHFEDISIAVQYGYANEEILFASLSILIPFTFDGLRPYIEQTRKIEGSVVDSARNFCSELEKLSAAWKSGCYLSSGRKIS